MITLHSTPSGFALHRKDRPLLTRQRHALCVPTQALAEAVAKEWSTEKPNPAAMPLYGLCCLALDVAGPERARLEGQLRDFLDTELICYYAESPEILASRQRALWQPVQQWFEGFSGHVLHLTAGIMPIEQSPDLHEWLKSHLKKMDDFHLAATHQAAAVSGSLFIALALCHGHMNAEQAFAAAQVEEHFQREQWGEDALANEKLQVRARALQELASFLRLLQPRVD